MVNVAGMLIVVTVDAQQFPVAAVRRIIVVIMIAVMHREFLQVGTGEFAPAAAADPGIHLERLIAVAVAARFSVAPGLGDQLVELGFIGWFVRWHVKRSESELTL